MPPKSYAWRRDNDSLPVTQGDLLVVAWGKTIHPSEASKKAAAWPASGVRDAFDLLYWGAGAEIGETWGRMNYGMVAVVADSCGIDKEYNELRRRYLDAGLNPEQAQQRAQQEAEPFVAVAEVWPIEQLPEHMRDGAESGAVGYVPFRIDALYPDDRTTYVLDLSRLATISWSAIHVRIAMGDPQWITRLQTALCRAFAARTIQLSENFAEAFNAPVTRAEVLTPPFGNPPRVRVRLHFENGETIDLEANPPRETGELQPESERPGLHTGTQ